MRDSNALHGINNSDAWIDTGFSKFTSIRLITFITMLCET
jgi:hypothetical protein